MAIMAYRVLLHKWLFSFVLLSFAFNFVVTGALAHKDHGHGHGEMHSDMNMDMDMLHTATQNKTKLVSSNTVIGDSYWTFEGGRFLLYSHIIIMTIGWAIILPISVMFSVAKSSLHVPTQAVFLVLHGFGVLCSVMYNSNTPDLYPKNAHHRMSWIATFVLVAQAVIGIVFLSGSENKNKRSHATGTAEERCAFIPAGFQPLRNSMHRHSWMSDSAHGSSDQSSNSSTRETRNASLEDCRDEYPEIPLYDKDDEEYETSLYEKPQQKRKQQSSIFGILAEKIVPKKRFSTRLVTSASFFYNLVQRVMIIWGFIIILSGLVTLSGAFKGSSVFNGLAHLVKGGIFFFYGILTLARYLGAWADIGWAWNLRPSNSMVNKWLNRIPSSEMTESFVIFLYGITNIWLEHLAAWGQEWSPMDLEHVSISLWFLGGGLCGMLLESRKLRNLFDKVLQSNLSGDGTQFSANIAQDTESTAIRSPNFNPAPSLVFFMLGILMGGHHQHAMLGAVIHKQWGMLLSGFSVMRLGTYGLLYLSPPSSYLPTRPFTELLGAFCLMSGGLIFMMSNASTVNYLVALNIDAMFVFTVMIGLTALLMSWEIILLAIKGWAAKREALKQAGRTRFSSTA